MKIEQKHIDQIQTAFQNMQTREDLLRLLNDVKPLVYGKKTVPFQLQQLTWFSNPKLAKKRYNQFKVKKKSGAERTIHAPVNGLKAIQKTLSFILQCVYEPHQAATGFVRDKSIVDNAKVHVGSKYVYNIDLKDFFPSIDQARIWKCIQLKPFYLIDTKEITDLQVNAEATMRPILFSRAAIDNPNNDIILILEYNGYRFSNSFCNLTLKDNGNIFYHIEKDTNKDFSGRITIYNNNTRIQKIVELVNIAAIEKGKNPDIILVKVIIALIEDHQNKRNKKNTRSKLANIISSLCCVKSERKRINKKTGEEEFFYVLPQGAPTSPVLSNIICQRLDYLLSAVAKRFGLKYTRYADDMTFSSMHNVYQPDSDFLKELHRIIAEQGFHIKESKTRLQKEGYRQEVTGLLVNENVNVQKRYIKQLRMWLYYWESYGQERAQSFFQQHYIADKGHSVKGRPDMINVIDGKLNYLKMVKGDSNDLYLKLKMRFDRLTSKQSFITTILNTWEADGIDCAMKLYYSKNKKLSTDNSEFITNSNDINGILDNILL